MRHSCIASATIILRSSKVRFFDPADTTHGPFCRSPPNSDDGYAAVAKLYWFVLRAVCIMDVMLHRLLADTATCVKPEKSAVLNHLQRSQWRIRHPYAVWLMGKLQSPVNPGTCSVKGRDSLGNLKLVFIAALGWARTRSPRRSACERREQGYSACRHGERTPFRNPVPLYRGHNGGSQYGVPITDPLPSCQECSRWDTHACQVGTTCTGNHRRVETTGRDVRKL